jgi:hypothetical protein
MLTRQCCVECWGRLQAAVSPLESISVKACRQYCLRRVKILYKARRYPSFLSPHQLQFEQSTAYFLLTNQRSPTFKALSLPIHLILRSTFKMQFTTAILAIFVASAVAVPTGGSGNGNECKFMQNNVVQQGQLVCCSGGGGHTAGNAGTQSTSGLLDILNVNAAIGDILSNIQCVVGGKNSNLSR